MTIANSFEAFVDKVLAAEMACFNTKDGQQLVQALLTESLKRNPEMTPAEWDNIRQGFMVYIFHELLKGSPDLMHELGGHLWKELQEATE